MLPPGDTPHTLLVQNRPNDFVLAANY
jgi:hypothetical protein